MWSNGRELDIMNFELLYFDGCKSWHRALENLRQALRLEGLDLAVSLVRIEDDGHARAMRFVGSPSIRLNGNELLPERTGNYGLICRVYRSREGLKGWPTVEMIHDGLREYLAMLQRAS